MPDISVGDISSLAAKMARLFVGFLIFVTIIEGSDQTPPKLYECRDLYKHKTVGEDFTYTFPAGVTCEASIQLPVSERAGINFTHVRNCVNYIKCEQYTCLECPCPGNTTYNPITKQCDDTRAVCSCNHTPTTAGPPVMSASTVKVPPTQHSTTVKVITGQKAGTVGSTPQPVDNGVIIIAAIVSATVIILVLLIVGFVLWQKGVFTLSKKPQMGPSNNDGYLHTLPPQERHVYAEIDDRMVPTDRSDRHAMSLPSRHMLPPTLPTSYPSTSHPETMSRASFHRGIVTRGSCPQHFYNTPTQQLTIAIPGQHAPPDYEVINHNRGSSCDSSLTTCSECSQCSAMSSHAPLTYTHDNVDRRTLLSHGNINNNAPPPQWNYVSKQVYI